MLFFTYSTTKIYLYILYLRLTSSNLNRFTNFKLLENKLLCLINIVAVLISMGGSLCCLSAFGLLQGKLPLFFVQMIGVLKAKLVLARSVGVMNRS